MKESIHQYQLFIWDTVLFLVKATILLIYGGWGVSKLWSWFIVPFGITAISVPWSIGLVCVVCGFRYAIDIDIRDKKGDLTGWEAFSLQLSMATVVLLAGYMAILFM